MLSAYFCPLLYPLGTCPDGLVPVTITADSSPSPGQPPHAPLTACVPAPAYEPVTNQLMWSYCFRAYCTWSDVGAVDYSVTLDWVQPEEVLALQLLRAGPALLDFMAPPQVIVYALMK